MLQVALGLVLPTCTESVVVAAVAVVLLVAVATAAVVVVVAVVVFRVVTLSFSSTVR